MLRLRGEIAGDEEGEHRDDEKPDKGHRSAPWV
jgi:hypothetical protein